MGPVSGDLPRHPDKTARVWMKWRESSHSATRREGRAEADALLSVLTGL